MAIILGINLSDLKESEIKNKINFFLSDQNSHYLVTPNPEIILATYQDEELFYILNKADLSLADGFGLKLAGYLSHQSITRLTGADLTPYLLDLAQSKNLKVLIMNWRGGLSKQIDIETALSKKYPQLNFLVLDLSRLQPLTTKISEKINNFQPTILFNTFGSPYQEKIIYHNLKYWPSTRLALGVGGAFDFITKKIQRAPSLWRHCGLEWLWRLFRQPSRWRRIYNATFVFSAKIIKNYCLNHYLYRPNVACFLYKKIEKEIFVLLVERQDDAYHWQLPQGGRDGEDLKTAGARELQEEINTNKFNAQAVFKNVYCYRYKKTAHNLLRRRQVNYRGQKQGLFIAEFIGAENDIKVNFWDHRAYKWVNLNNLINEVHPFRQDAAKIFIEKFKSLYIYDKKQ